MSTSTYDKLSAYEKKIVDAQVGRNVMSAWHGGDGVQAQETTPEQMKTMREELSQPNTLKVLVDNQQKYESERTR